VRLEVVAGSEECGTLLFGKEMGNIALDLTVQSRGENEGITYPEGLHVLSELPNHGQPYLMGCRIFTVLCLRPFKD